MTSLRTRHSTQSTLFFLTLLLSACGGGGGGGNGGSPNPSPARSTTGWQQGSFLDAASFFARCAAPRGGVNPATNQLYPDIQGSAEDENNFLRSYSNNTYLWYDEIADQDPGLFSDPLVYFDELKTTATTASGQAKDKFHFTYDSEAWFQLSQSGIAAGYGAKWFITKNTPPRNIVVAYTEPDSPATDSQVNLVRGAIVLTVDGADLVNGNDVDTLNAGLFPETIGESHTFEILDPGSQTTRTITMTSADVTSDPVPEVRKISTATGDVGYMVFNTHVATAEQALINAVDHFNSGDGITDLILDLRYNGGGFLDIASEFAYMIAGDGPTAGRPFETLQFNDQHPATNPVTGQPLAPTPFHTETQGFSVNAGTALPTLNLARVFVITGSGTCSASEAIMNGLRGVDVEVIQIGSTTCGKPYGFYAADNCGTTYFTIQFRGINARNFGDYTDGFSPSNTRTNIGTVVPGCSVDDDFTMPLGNPGEARLAAALDYRDFPNCPPVSKVRQSLVSTIGIPLAARKGLVPDSPWHNNRILRHRRERLPATIPQESIKTK